MNVPLVINSVLGTSNGKGKLDMMLELCHT